MLLTEFAEICKRVDREDMTPALCAKLTELGATSEDGKPITGETTSFNLIGYVFTLTDGTWSVANA